MAVMPSIQLTELEQQTLRTHGIVILWDRVIFEAQPPIDSVTLAWVQERCTGPIPQGLIDLWSVTAGGRIDYDVTISMGGGTQPFSWTELFYRGADTYFDLDGWIVRELEMAEETAQENGAAFAGKIDWLPFGGFEYLDRAYVRTVADHDHGAVLLWMQGLPAAWTHRLHENTARGFAPDVQAAFGKFYLAEHPVHGVEQYRAGTELISYVDERVDEHGLDRVLADRLIDFYAQAVVDWEQLLDAGTIAGQMGAVRSAFTAALHSDDSALINRLGAAGVRFDEPIQGSALATDLAIAGGCNAVLRTLLDSHAPVDANALRGITKPLDADVMHGLIDRGAEPTAESAAEAAAVGADDAARVIIAAFAAKQRGLRAKTTAARKIDAAFASAISGYEESLQRQRTDSTYFHWLGVDGLMERLERLRSFTR
jgi:hypothetical protein